MLPFVLRCMPSRCALPGWWRAPTPPLGTMWPAEAWTTSAPYTAWRPARATCASPESCPDTRVGTGPNSEIITLQQYLLVVSTLTLMLLSFYHILTWVQQSIHPVLFHNPFQILHFVDWLINSLFSYKTSPWRVDFNDQDMCVGFVNNVSMK